ncbi:MAG TPA: hypothetical protein VHK88_13770 [Aquihabitans sp.]|jgi:hypothetical protein|nr:hypothetical protein [Aquihabitans sp.]
MRSTLGLLGAWLTALVGLADLPARRLASFMDDLDEVWVQDLFLDQPDAPA